MELQNIRYVHCQTLLFRKWCFISCERIPAENQWCVKIYWPLRIPCTWTPETWHFLRRTLITGTSKEFAKSGKFIPGGMLSGATIHFKHSNPSTLWFLLKIVTWCHLYPYGFCSKLSRGAIFIVCSHTFILFWLRKPSVSIKSIRYVSVCLFIFSC